MTHLPKHLRPRWRYLAVTLETWPDATVTREAFQRHLWYAGQNLLGDSAAADADLSVVRFRFADGAGRAVVRVRRGERRAGRAALACLDRIDGDPVGVQVHGTSGTIRACEEKYFTGRIQDSASDRYTFDTDRVTAHVRGECGTVTRDSGFVGVTRADLRSTDG